MAKRIAQTRTWFVTTLVLLIVIATSAALVVAVAANTHERSSVDRRICRAVNKVNVTIEITLHRSLKTLPTLQYYKDHPQELAQQERIVRDEIVSFKPLDCKGL